MKAICLHTKIEIEAFLRPYTFLHLFAIGDLDEFFWQYTTWYALKDNEQIKEVVLLYTGTTQPTLLGLTGEPAGLMRDLLWSVMHLLPKRFYAHLSGDLAAVFAESYRVQSHGEYYKMALTGEALLNNIDTSEVIGLSPSDASDLEGLYRASYPGNWFDPRMLETGYYYGIRRDDDLVSVAGVHVYSPVYKVAALGNITTRPDFRGRGLAAAVTAKLCKALSLTVDHIGLNVKADNTSALSCYERMGFERIASYEECSLVSR